MAMRSGYDTIWEPHYQEISVDNCLVKVYGIRPSLIKRIAFHLLSIAFLGIPYMIVSWYPKLSSRLRYTITPLNVATFVLVINESHCSIQSVRQCTSPTKVRFFMYRHCKYVWLEERKVFGRIEEYMVTPTIDQYLSTTAMCLSACESRALYAFYGPNRIEAPVKSYARLFIDEVFNPFYIFQVFSMILWSLDEYMTYASCVLTLTLVSAIVALVQTRRQSVALHDLVESSKGHAEVQLLRKAADDSDQLMRLWLPAHNVVPGDVIVLPKTDFVLPCDCLLMTGQCIVNESMLTGESVPVTKTAPAPSTDKYCPDTHKRHTLFAGTLMIQSRYYGGEDVLARVVRTGFETTKGALIKSILFPTPVGLQFYRDSFKFVFVLFVIATVGSTYSIYLYLERNASWSDIVLRSLDIITIVVPPALPAAMTVGIVYSQNRLRKLKIFCISPPRINTCGKLKLACFDKTGTLTFDGLDMHSVIPVTDGAAFGERITQSVQLDSSEYFVQAMACCHSLTNISGKLNGDPLDLSMFEFTGWEFDEPGDDETNRYDMLAPTAVIAPGRQYEIGILRQFPFSSHVQCMTVICRELSATHMVAFTKGAPEKVASMCNKESLPADFYTLLNKHTIAGYRVIAMAYRVLPTSFKWIDSQKAKRERIEHDLLFCGFLIMQNPLKPETAPVMKILHDAKIRTLMITGDNILTAISVARDCGMIKEMESVGMLEAVEENGMPKLRFQCLGTEEQSIYTKFDHFAIDGKTWTKLLNNYLDFLPHVLIRTTIFARFQPDQKTQLIKHLQQLDYIVSMVGDGANDCGALKAAHVGVSLSQAEASVAAPFTSAIPNISCIVHLMLEGRCALVTSFSVFSYMALYSLIQFFTVLILYKKYSNLGDTQFLYVDLVITTVLAITIGRQGPPRKLRAYRPIGSLVSPNHLIPLFLQIIACGVFQLLAIWLLMTQDWYVSGHKVQYNVDAGVDGVETSWQWAVSDATIPTTNSTYEEEKETIICWPNTVMFTVSCFQYIILACVYSKGPPFRRHLCTNGWFLVCSLSLAVFGVYLMVMPSMWVARFFELMYLAPPPTNDIDTRAYYDSVVRFRFELLAVPIIHLLIAICIEHLVGGTVWLKRVVHVVRRKKHPKNFYKVLMKEDFRIQNL